LSVLLRVVVEAVLKPHGVLLSVLYYGILHAVINILSAAHHLSGLRLNAPYNSRHFELLLE